MPAPMFELPFFQPLASGFILGMTAPTAPKPPPSIPPMPAPKPIAVAARPKLYLSCIPTSMLRVWIIASWIPPTAPDARASLVAPFLTPAIKPALFASLTKVACFAVRFTASLPPRFSISLPPVAITPAAAARAAAPPAPKPTKLIGSAIA